METDRYGVPMTVGAATTAAIFDRAIDEYLCWRDDAVGLLQPAIESDPAFILGHSTTVALLLLSGTRSDDAQVVADLAAARATLSKPTAPSASCSSRATLAPGRSLQIFRHA